MEVVPCARMHGEPGSARFSRSSLKLRSHFRLWIFGSITGTSPGIPLASAAGTVTMPLDPDPYTDITIAFANVRPFVKTRGVLDANGEATAQITGGPLTSSAIGIVLYHAALVYDNSGNFYLATNPTSLLFE